MFKECSDCLVLKPVSAFHKQKGGRFGCHSKCRECRSQSKPEEREDNDSGLLRCSLCHEYKVRSGFYLKNGTRRGYSSQCRECIQSKRREVQSDLDRYIKELVKQDCGPEMTADRIRALLVEQEFECYISKHTMTYEVSGDGSTKSPMNFRLYKDNSGRPHLVCHYVRTLMDTYDLEEDELIRILM